MVKPVLVLFLITSLLLVSCATIPEEIKDQDSGTPEAESKKLDELQTTLCEEADKAGTCQTRMVEIGIVMPDECCEVLEKCC